MYICKHLFKTLIHLRMSRQNWITPELQTPSYSCTWTKCTTSLLNICKWREYRKEAKRCNSDVGYPAMVSLLWLLWLFFCLCSSPFLFLHLFHLYSLQYLILVNASPWHQGLSLTFFAFSLFVDAVEVCNSFSFRWLQCNAHHQFTQGQEQLWW